MIHEYSQRLHLTLCSLKVEGFDDITKCSMWFELCLILALVIFIQYSYV